MLVWMVVDGYADFGKSRAKKGKTTCVIGKMKCWSKTMEHCKETKTRRVILDPSTLG